MIRIDEIYYNTFVKALQHRSRVGLHWFDPFGSVNFSDICNAPPVDGIADLRLVFWDQEPVYQDTAKRFFDQYMSVYRGPTVLVTSEKSSRDLTWVENTYNIDSAYYFFHGWAALDWYRGYNHSYLSTPWEQRIFKHRLFFPNNIVGGRRAHRLALMSEMDQRDLVANNLVSFPEICPHEHQKVSDLFEKHKLPPLKSELPLIIDHGGNHAGSSHRIDFWDQSQSCFCHVVTETIYESVRIHLTEKIFKPIVLQQPFMVASAKGSLAYLRDYGFQTFSSLWSEDYDDADDSLRIKLIADNLAKINDWSESELEDARYQASSIVRHNFEWFYGGFQDLLWSELTGMIDQWR